MRAAAVPTWLGPTGLHNGVESQAVSACIDSGAQAYNISVMVETGRIAAVIFDLDGLMIDSERVSLRVWRAFLDEFDRTLSDEDYRSMIGMNTHASAAYVKRLTQVPLAVDEIVKDHRERLYEVIGRDAQPMPGLIDLVETLQGLDLVLGVASNSPGDYVTRALGAIRLVDAFPVIVAADQVQRGKPAPDVYLEASRRLKTAPEACMAIEDSPLGLKAALAAGMRCVVVPNHDLRGSAYDGALAVYASLPALHLDLKQLFNPHIP